MTGRHRIFVAVEPYRPCDITHYPSEHAAHTALAIHRAAGRHAQIVYATGTVAEVARSLRQQVAS